MIFEKSLGYEFFIEIIKVDKDLYFLQICKCDLIDNDLYLNRVYL